MNERAKLTPIRPRVGLTPGASGSAQESAKETQTTISIFNTSPSRHVTFQGALKNNKIRIHPHPFPPNLNHNVDLHRRATIPNPFLPPIFQ